MGNCHARLNEYLPSMLPKQLLSDINVDARGHLTAVELTAQTGLTFQRYFIIHNVIGGYRGGHAHKTTDQVLHCLQGSLTLSTIYNGKPTNAFLDPSAPPVFLPRLTWVEMHDVSNDCIILVVASDPYDITQSIRTYSEYLDFVQ